MQMRLNWVVLAAAAALVAPVLHAGTPPVDFDRQVRPILSDNCFTCHGPDDKHRMAGLHFDTKEGAFSKAGVIVPGDSAHSKMYLRISNPNVAMRMPPAYSGHKLTPAQIDTHQELDRSGRQVANALGIRRAETSGSCLTVKDTHWVQNAIDHFVLAKLEKEGLKPSPEADKATLLRRVTFDLTGLPPTPARTGRFLGRQFAASLRKGSRSPARISALRRAHGHAVARFRPLRRHARLPHRQRARDVDLARLGHQGIQQQHAL